MIRCCVVCLIGDKKLGDEVNFGKDLTREVNLVSIEKSLGIGIKDFLMLPIEDNLVVLSIKRRFLMSTIMSNLFKKSAPIIGLLTSAIVKTCGKFLLNCNVNVNNFFP